MLVIATLILLPREVTIIPTFLLFKQLGWLDTLLPLIVPSFFGGGAFYIFLLRQFFLTIPRDARRGGQDRRRRLVPDPLDRILLPLCAAGAGDGRDLLVPAPLERLPRAADLPEHAGAVHRRRSACATSRRSPTEARRADASTC